jgi:NAD(P)-dependent dehydrogenase (short-subunit alcohol dehydrogenase family)
MAAAGTPFQVHGQVAFVTGAAGGVGQGIARVLAAAGARVLVFDKDERGARVFAESASANGATLIAIGGDVTSERDVRAAVAETLTRFGRVDILVNNAAIVNRVEGIDTILGQDVKTWDEVMRVNLFGAFLCTKEALPQMIAQRYGRVVNISARLARMGAPSLGAAYGASKAGLEFLTKATAIQGAPHGVTCNGVAPYAVDAGMALTAPVSKDSVIDTIPVGRYCTAEEVGYATLFLASRESGFITGQTLHVNGGTLMTG